jgi:hypothetical protein
MKNSVGGCGVFPGSFGAARKKYIQNSRNTTPPGTKTISDSMVVWSITVQTSRENKMYEVDAKRIGHEQKYKAKK